MIAKKSYNELTFSDDFMFTKVMTDKSLCKQLLEIILDVKIKDIIYPEKQKSIDITYDGKSIRLDVYVDDDTGTVYDIEMQTTTPANIPKRTRYYQGMIDLNLINKGADYVELKKSFVIFICTKDLFGLDKPIYRFENYCREYDFPLRDEAYKLILNSASSELKDTALDKFLRFVNSGKAEDEFTEKLLSAVERAKQNKEWRTEYMTLLMRDNMNRAEGRDEGRDEVLNLLHSLSKAIPDDTEDHRKLLDATYEELLAFARKYNVEQ